MLDNVLIIFIIFHVFGDYYLQGKNIARAKRTKYLALLGHIALFIFSAIALSFLYNSIVLFNYLMYIVLSHLVIDSMKFIIENKLKETRFCKSDKIYVWDQLLHLLAIFIIYEFFLRNGNNLELAPFLNISPHKTMKFIRFILMLLLILKPTNITFIKMYSHLKPKNSEDQEINALREDEFKIGRIIGNMERLLVLLLLIVNQFAAIGLIFTAKSIIRFEKISKEKTFAEYYLLGTLFSMLATIVVFLLFKTNS